MSHLDHRHRHLSEFYGFWLKPFPGAFATAIVCPLAVALPAGFPMAILATDPKHEDFLDTPPRDGCSSHW